MLIVFLLPVGKSDLSLANQFIQLITSSGQTQNPFEIQNSSGSTLLKIDTDGNITINNLAGSASAVLGRGGRTEAASYVVFIESGNVYIRNATTGAIEFSGSVSAPAAVIQKAINTMNNTGGRILVKSGAYNLETSISLVNGTTFEGEVWNVGSLVGTKPNIGTRFILAGSFPGIVIDGMKGVTIRNFQVNGQKSDTGITINASNIVVNNSELILIQDVSSINSRASALVVQDSNVFDINYVDLKSSNEAGLKIFSSDDFHVNIGNVGSNNPGYGVWIRDSSLGEVTEVDSYLNKIGFYVHNSYGIRLVNNRPNANYEEGILIQKSVVDPYGLYNVIANNLVIENGQNTSLVRAAIRIRGETGFTARNNLVIGNMIYDRQSIKTHLNGVREENDAVNNTIAYNIIEGTNSTAISFVGGTTGTSNNTIVKGNRGFITENRGNNAVINNDTIAHGLSTTPSVVTITPIGFNVTAYLQSKNSTHFVVGLYSTTTGTNITSSVNVTWYAEA